MESLRQILQRNGIPLARTVYEDRPFLDFSIPVDKGLELKKVHLEAYSFRKVNTYLDKIKCARSSDDYREVKWEMESDSTKDKERKVELRRKKKQLEKQFREEAFSQIFGGNGEETQIYSVAYKSGVRAIDLEEVMAGADQDMLEHPWFLSDIGWFFSMTGEEERASRDIGMEGGSCLIGTDELLFRIVTDEVHLFDFNTMQEVTGKENVDISSETDTALYNFVQSNFDRIQSVEILCDKKEITTDEYQQMKYMFQIGRYYNAKMVVSIPDMSYEKTFCQTFQKLPKELYDSLYQEFMQHVYRIADRNLEWIEYFQEVYPVRELAVFHKRNRELLERFEQARVSYLDAYAQKHLTSNRDGRVEAIKDYVCMPALPYYLWGTRDVIEVNRLEEYPSIEKCKRIHNGRFHLHSMLFPQQMSENGKTSVFYAKKNYKKYVLLEKRE